MDKMKRLELLKDFIQEAVDRGAASIEEIHQYIADLPFEAFEKTGLIKADTFGLRSLSRRSIGMVYGAIRRINNEIGQLISDQFENIEETQEVSKLLSEHEYRSTGGKTAAVDPPLEPTVTTLPVVKKRAASKKTAVKKSVATKKGAKKTASGKKAAVKKPAARKR